MLPFLAKFLRNYPATQTKQILNLISQARERGEITNSKELKEQLDLLAEVVDEEELKIQAPFLYFYDGDMLESDALRTFVQKVQLDTEASLGEVEHLGNAIRAHHRILVDHYFNSVDSAISELEKKIKGYELLALYGDRGFNGVRVFDFNGSISVPGMTKQSYGILTSSGVYTPDRGIARTQEEGSGRKEVEKRDDFVTEGEPNTVVETRDKRVTKLHLRNESKKDTGVFVDKRGSQELFWSPPAHGEEGVRLAISEERFHTFSEVEIINDATTTASDRRVETSNEVSGNDIENILDGLPDTSWIHSIKTRRPVDSCRMKLFLRFSGAKRINAVSIDPVSGIAMKLVNASYLNHAGFETSISISETLLRPSTKNIVDLGDITAKGIFLTFQQSTGEEVDYVTDREKDGDFDVISPTTVLSTWAADQHNREEDIVIGDFIKHETKQVYYIDYKFGFKDITAIDRIFEENGLFIPEVFISDPVNSMSIFANIDYPTQPSVFTDVEFTVRKENFFSDGSLADVELFPILPNNVSQVQERLFLNQKVVSGLVSDAGILRFYPDFTQSFAVYSNTSLLTAGTEYEVSVDSGATLESVPPSTSPEKTPECLVILSSPRTDKIYTVVYTPLVSTQVAEGEVFVNKNKTITLERDEMYVFKNNRPQGEISRCNVTLQVIVRSNTLNTRITPFLKDVVLLLGIKKDGQS